MRIKKLKIEGVKTIQFKEMRSLLKQLSQKSKPTDAQIRKVLRDKRCELWSIEDNGEIIGIATLVVISIPTVTFARIEDVVIDEHCRGKGFGKQLTHKLLDRAKVNKVQYIDLTSKPTRKVANALYQKMGFEKRDTNVYRLYL